MNKFLSVFIFFCLTLTLVLSVLVLASKTFCSYAFNYKVDTSKNILIVGDSHAEYAVNDSILDNSFNLAQSGCGYFYSYLKAREVLKHNPKIDTLVVTYSYNDLMREEWFSGKKEIATNIKNHFFLFNSQDYYDLFQTSPVTVLTETPKTILHNLKMSYQHEFNGLGGYSHLDRNKLKENIQLEENEEIEKFGDFFSDNEAKYLIKIYNLCNKKKVKLILLNTPIHPFREKRQELNKRDYYQFAKENLPNALIVNHSNFKFLDRYYADLGHLNSQGATIYSNFLKEGGLIVSLQNQE